LSFGGLVDPGRVGGGEDLWVAAGAEAFREHRGELESLEPRLRIGIVVADPGSGVRLRDLGIREERGDGLTRHRRAPVRVDDLRGAIDGEGLRHHFGGEDRGLGRMDFHTDDVGEWISIIT
jgi:hypothetical protein